MDSIAFAAVDAPAKIINRYGAWLYAGIGLLLVLAVFLAPELAFAQDPGAQLATKGQNAVNWIKRGVYFILLVSVIGSGVLAAFGRMSWATVGQVLIGAIVAGLSTEVVTALYGSGT
ncbi:MAG: TrbC/VirB2 family protein [Burkholderiales bacterium]|nr:TrbC/VirB2 family protein [Burkholderiales bacterium]